MKNRKIVIGCLIAFGVTAVAATIGLYWFVYRPASELFSSFGQISEVAKMDEDIRNQNSFSPPEGNLLTQDQMDRFIRVQEYIESSLGTRVEELKAKYEHFNQQGEQTPGLADMVGVFRDLGGLLREAKQSQVEGLNREDFSKEEYRWVRQQVYASLGANIANLNLERIAEAIQTQNPEILTQKPEVGSVPEANRELVRPHEEQLMRGVAWIWLGL
jgi:hypothetical protein